MVLDVLLSTRTEKSASYSEVFRHSQSSFWTSWWGSDGCKCWTKVFCIQASEEWMKGSGIGMISQAFWLIRKMEEVQGGHSLPQRDVKNCQWSWNSPTQSQDQVYCQDQGLKALCVPAVTETASLLASCHSNAMFVIAVLHTSTPPLSSTNSIICSFLKLYIS